VLTNVIYCVIDIIENQHSISDTVIHSNVSTVATASVAYRKWVASKGRDSFYEDIVRSQFHFAK